MTEAMYETAEIYVIMDKRQRMNVTSGTHLISWLYIPAFFIIILYTVELQSLEH